MHERFGEDVFEDGVKEIVEIDGPGRPWWICSTTGTGCHQRHGTTQPVAATSLGN